MESRIVAARDKGRSGSEKDMIVAIKVQREEC